jgi:hypothetical protein
MIGNGGQSGRVIRESLKISLENYLEVLCDFTNEPLEGQLPNQKLSGLLITSNFTKGDGSRPEPVRLLYTSGRCL